MTDPAPSADPAPTDSPFEDCELHFLETGDVDGSWRLNFNGFQLGSDVIKRPKRRLKGDCPWISGLGKDAVAEYYQQQVEMLEQFDEMDYLTERGFLPGRRTREEREKIARRERLAIRLSNIANVGLFGAKIYASTRSRSLAIIASTFDSLLDILSSLILWFTASSLRAPNNPYRFPLGKKRMQPLGWFGLDPRLKRRYLMQGIVVFASVMASLSLQIIVESVQTLITDNEKVKLTKEQEGWIIGLIVSVTFVRFLLVFYCRAFTDQIVKTYPNVVNDSLGLIAALLAKYTKKWIDPLGAIILALFTIRTWSSTVVENVKCLVGEAAAPEYLQSLTYLCWNHHKAIRYIDTIRAYTFGSHYFVEVDIVLPPDMPLQESHDIGESLQEKLEMLPEIERAFVHVDYEFTHKPEHQQSRF